MDDNLIAEAVSAISDPPGASRFIGAPSSPPSGGTQTSLKVVLVLAYRVPLTRGFLRREFLRPSSSIVILDYLLEPVQSSPEALGCP
jgi:hypothetical protein